MTAAVAAAAAAAAAAAPPGGAGGLGVHVRTRARARCVCVWTNLNAFWVRSRRRGPTGSSGWDPQAQPRRAAPGGGACARRHVLRGPISKESAFQILRKQIAGTRNRTLAPD